ncbi:hypothetical protein [Phenylobacterium sp.]|uniref:hypothetical protein n=1 Tax=Phenylobacterium sp. TaxID=1871053 RepID=UPI00301D53BB
MKRALTSRDWFGKSSAGLLLGFFLALGAGGLFKALAGVGDTFFSTKGQLAMWMMAPVWALVLSFCFMFRSTARAWGWLAAANVVLWGAIWALGGIAP